MIPLSAYQGKKIGVFGLGKAGKAAIAALEASGAEVYGWDDSLESGAAEQEERRGAHYINYTLWPWSALEGVVLSPGVPLTHPQPHGVVMAARAAGCPILGEVELLQQACPGAYKIGITGTNGKSTTTALIGHILTYAGRNPQVGGNLGTPALALQPQGKDGVFVLEMSSFQLDLMQTVRFNVAVWLNITPDHLDRHGDMEGYIAAKKHIFERQQAGDVAIIGVDDAYSEAVARELIAQGAAQVIPVTVGGKAADGIEVTDGRLLDRRDDTRIDLRDCKGLKGAHNWQNAAAAYAACRVAGIPAEIISGAMQSFPGLDHRMEWVKAAGNVVFVNDSKATNADSTSKALAAYAGDIYWILGGRPKAGGITSLAPYFPRIAHAYLLGEAEEAFAQTLEGQVPYSRCGDLKAATRAAAEDALKAGKGVVLLSPACASWDQWPNFEVRGDAFKEYVEAVTRVQSTEFSEESNKMGQEAKSGDFACQEPAEAVRHGFRQEAKAGRIKKESFS